MLNRQIQNIIPSIHDYFIDQPVKYVYLFGSYSRGEETDNSDIDLLVKLDNSQPIGLFKYVSMITDLEKITGKTIDLVEEDGLDKYAKPFIDNDKILIYERAD